MKSCLGLLLSILILAAVLGTAALIWHLSYSSEYKTKPVPAAGAH